MIRHKIEACLNNGKIEGSVKYTITVDDNGMLNLMTFEKSVGLRAEFVKTIYVPSCKEVRFLGISVAGVAVSGFDDKKKLYSVSCFHDGGLYFELHQDAQEPVVSPEQMEDHLAERDELEGDTNTTDDVPDMKLVTFTNVVKEYMEAGTLTKVSNKYGLPIYIARAVHGITLSVKGSLVDATELKTIVRYVLGRTVCDYMPIATVMTTYNHRGSIDELAEKLDMSVEATIWLSWLVNQVIRGEHRG